jgi:hypothetical protein
LIIDAPKLPGRTTVFSSLRKESIEEVQGRKPHVPVMSAFGAGRLHVCRLHGSFDLDKAASDHADAMFRSIRWVHTKNTKVTNEYWDDLTFQLGRHLIFTWIETGPLVLQPYQTKPKRWRKNCFD